MSNKIANAHEIIIGSCAIRGDKFASEAQHWLPSRDEISVFIFVCIRRTVPSIIHDGYNVDRDVYHRDVYRVFFFFLIRGSRDVIYPIVYVYDIRWQPVDYD